MYYFIVEICTEGDIRLSSDYEGYVEVCHYNEWGSVCGNLWDSMDGIVACHQLGLLFLYTHVSYAPSRRRVWLDHLSCTGSETRLIDCVHDGFDLDHRCYYQDAKVFCSCK